jgi:hypothetical protein
MKERLVAPVFALLLLVAALPASVIAQGTTPISLPVNRPVNASYAQIKAQIDAHAPGVATGVAQPTGATAPTAPLAWPGLSTNGFSPSDATGALGPDRYIEMVNTAIGVYDRSGNFLSTNLESTFTGFSNACGDGSILWDAGDQRFYISMLNLTNCQTGATTPYTLIFGFSKTATPSANASDWCAYTSNFGVYGSALPDYPKLGTTKDFILMGVNRFNGNTYVASDVAWASKPAAGTITTCPSLSSFTLGVQKALKNADGTLASTPVPARQTDSSGTGFVVANEDPGSGTSTALSVYTVTKNTTTGAAQFSRARAVTVASYAYPPSAPQPGTTTTLDTLDARLMNAWVAPDPVQGGKLAIWTQHTVAASTGGLGSEVRWYEINASTGALFQNGIAQSPSLYAFMGAIAPDRNGTTHKFGYSMVLGFNTTSSSSLPAAQMISKVGSNPQSAFVKVATSAAADKEFTCYSPYGPPCRWGDYSGASPDPAATSAGRVWVTVMMANGGSSSTSAWTTENWEAAP